MSTGELINWDAVAAVAAALTFVATIYFFWRGGARSIVTARASHIEGKFEGRRIIASRIVLHNRGSHISQFAVRFDHVYNSKSFRVSETTSIDQKFPTFIKENNDIIFSVPDLPSGEKIAVDIFADNEVSCHTIKGGSSKFVIKEISNFYFRRFVIIFCGFFIIAFTLTWATK